MILAPPSATPAAATASRPRRVTAAICFTVPALAMLAFGGQLLVTGWTTQRAGGTHHVHDLAWGALEGLLLLVALVVALLHRRSRPSAVLQAVAVVASMLVTMVLVAQPDPFAAVLALLVLGGGVAYGGVRGPVRLHRPSLVLTGVAAVPLVGWALSAAADQRADADEHAELLGYTGVTAFALALVAVLLVAGLRRPGWRSTAVSAAAAAAIVGTAGLLWPDDASSPGRVGGVALLALAVCTIGLSTAPLDHGPGGRVPPRAQGQAGA
jgi:peptidoglycan/LPS O-acetylase OafA/YrhL